MRAAAAKHGRKEQVLEIRLVNMELGLNVYKYRLYKCIHGLWLMIWAKSTARSSGHLLNLN